MLTPRASTSSPEHTLAAGDVLARNVAVRGPTPIEMTQASWHYATGP